MIPTDVRQIAYWFKADSLALSDGTKVSTWADSSGGGHDATQATGASQPTFKTAQINGLPALLWGANSMQSAAVQSTVQTVIAMVKMTSLPQLGAIVAASANNGMEFRSGTGSKAECINQGISGVSVSTSTDSVNTWTLRHFDFVPGAAWRFFKNGAADGSGSSGTTWTGGLTLWLGNTPAGEQFIGYIAEICAWTRLLSVSEKAGVDSYFQDKYAVSVSDYVDSSTKPGRGGMFMPDVNPKGWF